jgi:hypothetical protein
MQNSDPDQIVNALSSVPERTMRTNLLIEKLCALEPEKVADVLQAIIVAAAGQRGDYCLALDALDIAQLTDRAGNSFMSDVYVRAQREGFEELVRLLSRPGSSRVFDTTGEGSSDDVPSGVRVSMAKSGTRDQLTHMISDTDARVIHPLLKNPVLTESDLLKLASRRPAVADVQREIFHSRKWSRRYAVKKALALNPYTPTDIGMKIVHVLMVQDLRLIAESRDLHQWLREAARERLKEGNKTAKD